ncbi:MAG: penicillin-binding transpeptidase domain-containing protein, partial [Fimbriimonadales bacterium]|nr:penicillin-binding transpeptidase domain-containing protein [Fimbriimonadales bacterium]
MSSPVVEPARLRLVAGTLALGFLAAVIGQARVQIFERERILERARHSSRFYVQKTLPAKRGTVYSSDGVALAEDWDAGELRINSNQVPRHPAFFVDLAAATGIAPTEIASLVERRRGTGSPGIVWRKPIGMATVEAVEAVRARWRADGVSVARGGVRHYPLGSLAAGVVGFVREGGGETGIEKGLEPQLAGRDGFQAGIIDRRGEFLSKGVEEYREPRHGEPVVLTIDSQIQRAASLAVRRAVEENDADSGVAVVLDPKSGDILAMANWPAWSPGEPFPQKEPWRHLALVNPAVSNVFEPGSTFKVLTLCLGLDREVLTTGTTCLLYTS